jgi:hypothetical protein
MSGKLLTGFRHSPVARGIWPKMPGLSWECRLTSNQAEQTRLWRAPE